MSATGTVLAQVWHSPTWAGQSAYAAGATTVGGPKVAPLHAARDRKQLKIDATTYTQAQNSGARPEIRNKPALNKYLKQVGFTLLPEDDKSGSE
ncbi:hypothetical protein EST38_g14649 [Candolleomyces aberdarensis]|uniref:Uncharacterized protein n=1 Tax=Candolleomyces aberdarensis TaxID=2316362 RepID=A0A4Q2CYL4_9AGAR|nr:hypothetical protein EST38_g14649 [Candolleomyces aberdarensis]